MKIKIAAILAFVILITTGLYREAHAQLGGFDQSGTGGILVFPGAPSGACIPNLLAVDSANGAVYSCASGMWTIIGGTTVTFAGDLSGTSSSQTVIGINSTSLAGLATGILKNTTGTGIPSIAVAGTDYAAAAAATTVNGQTCTLSSSCTIPFQTNSGGNTSQAGINLETSTTNSVGLTVTPVNSGTNVEKFEITGSAYTGTASNLSGTPTVPNGTAATTQTALDNSTKLATTAYADSAVAADITFPFGAPLPNVKYVSGYANLTSTGATSLYTVPSNRRAAILGCSFYNNSGSSSTVQITVNVAGAGTLYPLTVTSAPGNSTASEKAVNAIYVGEATDQFEVSTTQQPVNVWCRIIEFDTTSPLKTVKITSFAASDNTVYTVPANKTAVPVWFAENGQSMLPATYSNISGGAITVHGNFVPSGSSPGSTNQYTVGASTNSGSVSSFNTPPTMNTGDFFSINSGSSNSGQLGWITVIEH